MQTEYNVARIFFFSHNKFMKNLFLKNLPVNILRCSICRLHWSRRPKGHPLTFHSKVSGKSWHFKYNKKRKSTFFHFRVFFSCLVLSLACLHAFITEQSGRSQNGTNATASLAHWFPTLISFYIHTVFSLTKSYRCHKLTFHSPGWCDNQRWTHSSC